MFYLLSFVKEFRGLVSYNTPCFAKLLVKISNRTRDRGQPGQFPMISTTCEGHQPSKASLMKAKVERIRKAKLSRKKQHTNNRHNTRRVH